MTDTKLIFTAIPAILADVEAIGKGRKNQQQGYAFRGIDDVYNAIHPLLAKHKVFPTCEIIDRDFREGETKAGSPLYFVSLRAKYTLWASDGSSVTTEAWGEAMDSADKASNKAMSAAYKYALFQLLCIPTEAQDADADTPEPAPRRQQEARRGEDRREQKPAEVELSTKDKKLIAECVQMFAEAQSQAEFAGLVDMLKASNPDAALAKADNREQVRKQIWDAVKTSKFAPKSQAA